MRNFFFFLGKRFCRRLCGFVILLFMIFLGCTLAQGDKIDSTTSNYFRRRRTSSSSSWQEHYTERHVRNLEMVYPHSIPMWTGNTTTSLSNGLDLYWRIDDESSRIYLAFAYYYSDNIEDSAASIGWLAFGIGEAGGMPGADMVIIENLNGNYYDEQQRKSEVIITDRYSTAYDTPLVDPDNKCDWTLENVHRWSSINNDNNESEIIDGNNDTSRSDTTTTTTGVDDDDDDFSILVVEVSRPLITDDERYDRPIRYDASWDVPPHRILMAWGFTNQMTYHGKNHRISVSVRFFESDEIQPGKDKENFDQQVSQDEFFEVRMHGYIVPAIPTKYANHCVKWEDILLQQYSSLLVALSEENHNVPFHMIGFAPIVETKFPHHMVLYGYTNKNCANEPSTTQDRVSLHGWAIGEGPQLLPNQVGLPLGGEDGYRSFALAMHYDNRDLSAGIKDSSGFRIYYTPQLRPKTLSLLLLADPLISLNGQPIVSSTSSNGLSQHSFTCPSRCTEAALESSSEQLVAQQEAIKSTNTTLHIPHEITVIKELLHMHEKGISMTNKIIRGDTIIHEGKIDYWDNRMSGLFPTVANFTIQPGDIFETTCTYHSQETVNTVFGTGSEDEMCIAFLYYYPALPKDRGSFFDMCGKDTRSNRDDPCVGEYNECDLPNLLSVGRSFGENITADLETICPVGLPETSDDIRAFDDKGTFESTEKHQSSSGLHVTPTFRFWIIILLLTV